MEKQIAGKCYAFCGEVLHILRGSVTHFAGKCYTPNKSGAEIRALYDGDLSGHSGDHSRAAKSTGEGAGKTRE